MLRRFVECGDLDSGQRVAEALLERWGAFVRSATWKWFPESESDREDMVQEVHTRLWKELLQSRKGFWEANFIHALKCLCFDVGSKMRKAVIPTARHGSFDTHADSLSSKASPQEKQVLQTEMREWIKQAILILPSKERRAISLYYIHDWPISSKDPSVMTISMTLGVGARMVRNYLRRGKRILRRLCEEGAAHGQA